MSDPLVYVCNPETYANGSVYESNLNGLLDNLVDNTSQMGFNASSYGESPDKVYGLLQCRGDGSHEDCFDCSVDARKSVLTKCPNAVGGRLFFEMCFLRFEKSVNFVWELNTSPYCVTSQTSISTAPYVFDDTVRSLVHNLSITASDTANIKRFAAGSSIDSYFHRIFASVQCCRAVSKDDCLSCLTSAIDALHKDCAGQSGCRLYLGSCFLRYDMRKFVKSEAPSVPMVVEAPKRGVPTITPFRHKTQKESKKLPITLGSIGAVLIALLILSFAMRNNKIIIRRPIIVREDEEGNEINVANWLLTTPDQMVFGLESLRIATENFDDVNKLGEGGFGPGRTSDGREIAVKKLSLRSNQGKREFMNEVKLLAKIQHRNLVKLLGCCAEGPERLLVYEYLPNRSLDAILFHQEMRRQFDWQQRYNIILGIARGLLYLHQDSALRIIHRDIKASNILLDLKLNPKIADFGLARMFPDEETHVSTKVAGTFGYIAPEYALKGRLTEKADIYSFGVLLLEIVSGRKNTDLNLLPEMKNLLEWAWVLHQGGRLRDMIDRTLNIDISEPQEQAAIRCIDVALLCTQADPANRPSMSNIILMISSNIGMLPNPTKPAFVNAANNRTATSRSDRHEYQRDGSSSATSPSNNLSVHVYYSKNDASITQLEPR
eukprot:Gb_32547 [translate_table: standard]